MIPARGRKSMQPIPSARAARRSLLYPGESRRILGELETPGVKVEEMAYAAGLCVARHSHDTANFIYTIAGTHWSGYSRGGEICAPRTVRFLPAGEPHENYFPVGCRCLGIELRGAILELAAEHGQTISAPGEVAGGSAVALGVRLHREFRRKDDAAQLDIESVILELLLHDGQEPPSRRGGVPCWLLQIREMLREQEQTRMSLAELSRCVGRHPVQISRQFHQHFGCTISEYMRRVRIAKAQSLLGCGEMTVAEIALACGFSDQSHFTTAFRRIAGVTPARYRMEAAGGGRRKKMSQHLRNECVTDR